jgi:hypothetical protein
MITLEHLKEIGSKDLVCLEINPIGKNGKILEIRARYSKMVDLLTWKGILRRLRAAGFRDFKLNGAWIWICRYDTKKEVWIPIKKKPA